MPRAAPTKRRAPAPEEGPLPPHEQVRRGRGDPREPGPRLSRDPANLVPSGCTLLDVALSETHHGGWHLGTLANLVGDTRTGKSILTLTGLACCANDERFDEFRLIYDDTEQAGNVANMGHLFGRRFARRVERPNPKSDRLGSATVEAFRSNVYRALEDGRPFVYVADSLDGFSAVEEQERVRKDSRKFDEEDPKKDQGSYKTEKPRLLSEFLRVFYGDLQGARGLVLCVSQVRANLDPMSRQKYRRNGGKALDHWAQHIAWMFQGAPSSRHTRQVWGKARRVGDPVLVKIEKNRLTGKRRRVAFDLLQDYGVDDVGALVDWLVEEKRWKGGGSSKIKATDLGLEALRGDLIEQILAGNLERRLAKVAARAWAELEKLCAVERGKPRFE